MKSELEFCLDYLKMQKIRFDKALDYVIKIDEKTVETTFTIKRMTTIIGIEMCYMPSLVAITRCISTNNIYIPNQQLHQVVRSFHECKKSRPYAAFHY